MALRILIDARHATDFGYGSYIRNLVGALSTADHDNHYLLAVQPRDLTQFQQLPANFQPIPYSRTDSDPIDQLSFPLFIRKLRVDFCHIPLNIVPLFLPAPYLVTAHDLGSLMFERGTGLRHSLRLLRFRRGLTRASCIITVSETTRRDLIELLNLPPERIRQIYSAPDPVFLPPHNQREAEARHEIRRVVLERYQVQHPFLLYVGNSRPQKNLPRLIEAFAVLRASLADHQGLRLVLIGNEISRNPAVRSALLRSRLEQNVRFLGSVPLETLRSFYEEAAAFVFPSLYEGFGLPPLEAMACGTPVITSKVSSLPEVVGDAAWIVNPENVFDIARGIQEVLLRPELRATLIARGHDQVARFRWENTVQSVLALYRELGHRHQ